MFLKILIILFYQCFVTCVVSDDHQPKMLQLRKLNMCTSGRCVSKCCPEGMVYLTKTCVIGDDKLLGSKQIVHQGASAVDFVHLKQTNDIVFGIVCKRRHIANHEFYLQQNGSLYVQIDDNNGIVYGPDKYCIDNFVNGNDNNSSVLNALICFVPSEPEPTHYGLSSTCMLISCFFIILTVAVYAWLPELRNLHGMVLMAYLLSFFVGFVFLAAMQILLIENRITVNLCTGFTFVIYFALLAAFFWMNVMCYDIWWTFSGKRTAPGRKSSVRRRFLSYSLYAFGVPTVLTIVLAVLEFAIDPQLNMYLPRIRKQGCFLYKQSKLLYLYLPIIVLCVANLVFFTLTALKIAEIKKQTQVLNKKDKQRFSLYIKLFILMGVNWILEVVSSFYPEANYVWQFTDAYNVLVGLIIFIIFVCKRKTLRLIQQRVKSCQQTSSNVGEMDDVNKNQLSRWQNSKGVRASIDTVRTTLGPDADGKSLRSERSNTTRS